MLLRPTSRLQNKTFVQSKKNNFYFLHFFSDFEGWRKTKCNFHLLCLNFSFLPQQLGGDISNGCSKDYSTLIMEERFKAEERKEIIGEEWRKISKIFDRQIIF